VQSTREQVDQGFNDFWNRDSISAAVKSGDKQGTGFKWVRQGDTFVPQATTGNFDVNTNNDHTIPALAFASFFGGGLAANAAMTGSASAMVRRR